MALVMTEPVAASVPLVLLPSAPTAAASAAPPARDGAAAVCCSPGITRCASAGGDGMVKNSVADGGVTDGGAARGGVIDGGAAGGLTKVTVPIGNPSSNGLIGVATSNSWLPAGTADAPPIPRPLTRRRPA